MRNILLFILLFGVVALNAQELNCKVTINSDKIESADTELYNTLQQSITEYMNDRKWSNAQIAVNERIECTIYITVNSVEDIRYNCDIQIQASRPVYNSNYTTTTFNFKDTECSFTYQEYEPLVYNENIFENNLTCILNFYANIILGIDFDTFSLKGGELFFDQAEKFAMMGQSSQEAGWEAFGSTRNRAAILAAFTEERMSPYRELLYNYHRKGLDEMSVSVDKGRKVITEAIKNNLTAVYDINSMSVIMPMFSDSKLDELVNIYSEAPQTEREEVYKILSDFYPTEEQRLSKIKKGKETP
ncbi:MAG: DUF4835 family protein [Bacteroidales bacterium]|nr:DUF4835 family protein [Bacteroidales bacterium]